MKRTACALALAMTIGACPVFAQPRFGFDAGINLSTFHYERDDVAPMTTWRDRKGKLLPTFGGAIEFPLRERLALSTGLRYVQHGLRVEVDDVFAFDFDISLHYLSAPILLSVRPFPSRRFFISAGPEVALLLAASSEHDAPSLTNPLNIRDDMDPTNLSLDGEAGVELPLGPRVVLVRARYSHGVAGAAKESHWVSDWSTRGSELLLGVRW